MPTSEDLKSGDAPPPPKKKEKSTSMAPNRLGASNVHLNPTKGKGEEDIRSLPRTSKVDLKVELKSSEDFSILAQRIRKVF